MTEIPPSDRRGEVTAAFIACISFLAAAVVAAAWQAGTGERRRSR
jgi:hypothetical protein